MNFWSLPKYFSDFVASEIRWPVDLMLSYLSSLLDRAWSNGGYTHFQISYTPSSQESSDRLIQLRMMISLHGTVLLVLPPLRSGTITSTLKNPIGSNGSGVPLEMKYFSHNAIRSASIILRQPTLSIYSFMLIVFVVLILIRIATIHQDQGSSVSELYKCRGCSGRVQSKVFIFGPAKEYIYRGQETGTMMI